MKKAELDNGWGFNLDVPKLERGLAGKFILPPFSILNTMAGDWQKRKNQWLSLGIKSEEGRFVETYKIGDKTEWEKQIKKKMQKIEPGGGGGPNTAYKRGFKNQKSSGTSVFDPVLCELMYVWFCPEGGQVVDPFAGGSVRGIISAFLNKPYWGCELRKEQVEANIQQGKDILPMNTAKLEWVCGDSEVELDKAPMADFIFSCPPYGNLEVYSDDVNDLSNKTYDEFKTKYRRIIQKTVEHLKVNRFACFVVGNFRERKTGVLNNLVGDTINIFEDFDCPLYNDIIFATPIGSLPVRVGRQFEKTRKIGKMHQNVLVFYKGDTRKIKSIFGQKG